MSRSFGATSLTTLSPMRSVPALISSRPAIIRRLVVFPQPDGPTRTMNSPSPISRLRSFTAWKSPYIFWTFSNVTVAMAQPPLPADHRGPMHPAAEAERGRAPYEDGSGSGHRSGGATLAQGSESLPRDREGVGVARGARTLNR